MSLKETEINKEKELLLLVSDGDEVAFRQLFHVYFPILFPVLVQVVKANDIAEDIIQETFMRLWIYRDKLPSIENPKAWIFKIAYHQAFTYLKKNTVRQNALKNVSREHQTLALKNETEEALSFKTMTIQVKKAVQNLPPQQKKVYQLSREGGFKIPEIADQMNLSTQSVKNTLVRALKFIREYIRQDGLLVLALLLINFLQ